MPLHQSKVKEWRVKFSWALGRSPLAQSRGRESVYDGERSKPCKERGSDVELLEAEQFLLLGCYVDSQPLDPGWR